MYHVTKHSGLRSHERWCAKTTRRRRILGKVIPIMIILLILVWLIIGIETSGPMIN